MINDLIAKYTKAICSVPYAKSNTRRLLGELIEEVQDKITHDTKDGFCCACDVDIAKMKTEMSECKSCEILVFRKPTPEEKKKQDKLFEKAKCVMEDEPAQCRMCE